MKRTPASSRQLSVLAVELQEELEQTGLFTRIGSKKTGVSGCALVITCSLADTVTPQKEVIRVLTQAVDSSAVVLGQERDSYKITTLSQKVEIQFSMFVENNLATGRIEVIGIQ